MKTKPRPSAGRQFLIRPLRYECDEAKFGALCAALQRLGGRRTATGFAFATATARSMAIDLLGEKFGSRYFEVIS